MMRSLIVLLLFLLVNLVAEAREAIERYHTTISILPSGAIEVAETITVRAEGAAIRRGIYRDFQTDYHGRQGGVRVGFEVLEVRQDGAAAAYRVESIASGKRVRIGSPDRLLDPGLHDYLIRFRTTRQIIHLEERDEIVYQPIAYGWAFPILEAEALFRLPDGAALLDIKASAGPPGAAEGGARIERRGDGLIAVIPDRSLGPREGLTVALAFEKGFVTPPDAFDEVVYFLKDNIGTLLAAIGLLVTFGYYLLTWRRIGRDPKGGVIIARYEPPKGFSPAALRYVGKRRWDDTAFSSAILNLAVKGVLIINEQGRKKYQLERKGDGALWPRDLSSGEKALLSVLLPKPGDSIAIDKKNHAILASARKAHQRALRREHHGIHFRTNRSAFLIGLLLSVAFIAPALLLAEDIYPPMIILMAATAILHPLFAWLLEAPTIAGRAALDEIQGFRRYLMVAEKDRMNFHNPPERTPELFERYLPHAVALGVEQEWGEQFDDVLKAVRDPKTGESWSPGWYHGYAGSRFAHHAFRASAFSSSVGGALAAGFSAAATPPSSQSGSGFSGGFSGGMGGGGGGGGGW